MAEDAGYPPELVADVLKGVRADIVRYECLSASKRAQPLRSLAC